MSCEYRVMVNGKYGIGLNETTFGSVAPKWFMDVLKNTVGTRNAELALTLGKMFSVDEALKVGLIDDKAANKAEAIKKCLNFLNKFEKIPQLARGVTKQKFRQDTITNLIQNKENDLKEFLDHIADPNHQKNLQMYIASLKQRTAKK